jgi:hypothetical protein
VEDYKRMSPNPYYIKGSFGDKEDHKRRIGILLPRPI